MLKIGEFSKLCHVSVRMLRHFEEMGLLLPERLTPLPATVTTQLLS